jgi:hypothetical protein
MAKHHRLGLITHLCALILSFLSLILMLIVLLLNVPLTTSTRPYGDEASARWWLIRITEVDPDSPRVPNSPVPVVPLLSIPTAPHYKPYTPAAVPVPTYRPIYAGDRRSRGVEDEDEDGDDEKDDNKDKRDRKEGHLRGGSVMTGRQAYGFGAWGWCEWRREDIWDEGSCVVKAFWRLPRDAPEDRVSNLDLPG